MMRWLSAVGFLIRNRIMRPFAEEYQLLKLRLYYFLTPRMRRWLDVPSVGDVYEFCIRKEQIQDDVRGINRELARREEALERRTKELEGVAGGITVALYEAAEELANLRAFLRDAQAKDTTSGEKSTQNKASGSTHKRRASAEATGDEPGNSAGS